jgi:hypothetical protein
MDTIINRFFTPKEPPPAPDPGIYQTMFPEDAEKPNRLHLRVESDLTGILLVQSMLPCGSRVWVKKMPQELWPLGTS